MIDLTTDKLCELEPQTFGSCGEKCDFIYNHYTKEMKINGDRGELRRVITNLCGNAITYTQNDGKVEVLLRENGGDIIFSVTDNGDGIPKEDIPHLFKRFSQGTSKKRSTGTGLGLYLSRQIVEAHNGKIWLESKLHHGSEFSFVLSDAVVYNTEYKERQVVNG